MTPPAAVPTRSATVVLAPWALFGVLLVAALVSFFLFADRVPSLMQALAER